MARRCAGSALWLLAMSPLTLAGVAWPGSDVGTPQVTRAAPLVKL